MAVDDVKSTMEELGESVIAVGDAQLLRVHVHTLRPGKALEFAVDHGTLAKVKVENMELQHQAFSVGQRASSAADEAEQVTSVGVIAVTPGDGLARVFRSMGATVVPGGQSMNPSVQDILTAIGSAGYRELIVLPNNSNIVLTARQVAEMTPHDVRVIPTTTVPQGIGALLAFNFQADLDTNVTAMEHATRAIHTVEITRAVRDAEVDDIQVTAGQMLGIYDGKAAIAADSVEEALLRSLNLAPVDALEIVTLYYGADSTEEGANALAARVREAHPGLDVEVVAGGQPHYPYIVSLE
jgi:dihydroxyacetone kinase-like predicted kinase